MCVDDTFCVSSVVVVVCMPINMWLLLPFNLHSLSVHSSFPVARGRPDDLLQRHTLINPGLAPPAHLHAATQDRIVPLGWWGSPSRAHVFILHFFFRVPYLLPITWV